jgi:hypothetical protein
MKDKRIERDGLTFSQLSPGNYHLAKFGPFGHMTGLGDEKPPVTIQISERSIASIFNTDVEYQSNELPTWFQPLRYVFEDEGFTKMTIQIADVRYTIKKKGSEG